MSKRRKEGDEEEDKPFKLPKFDEEAFLKRERRNIKTTFISFLFGLLMSFICFAFWALIGKNNLRWELVLLVAVINAAFLKYLFLKFNVDLTGFTKMNWFSSFLIYFATWLIVFVIIVNPPFYDDESPRVEVAVLPTMQEPGGNIIIAAKITDNTGIEKGDITFTVDGNSISPDNFDYIDNIFRYIYEGPSNLTGEETHNFTLNAKDHSGNTNVKTGSFSFSDDVIYLALPKSGETVQAASDIKFGVKTDVWRVYYTVNNGSKINATRQTDRKDYYLTSPEYKGWTAGENVSVNVSAEILYNFENDFLRDVNGNLILDSNKNAISRWFVNYINGTSTYNFNVAGESTIGQKDSVEISTPNARIVGAPGFETIVFLVSIVIAILIFKYRKKNESNKK